MQRNKTKAHIVLELQECKRNNVWTYAPRSLTINDETYTYNYLDNCINEDEFFHYLDKHTGGPINIKKYDVDGNFQKEEFFWILDCNRFMPWRGYLPYK